MTEQLYSYHAFLFPFTWEINQKINIKKIKEYLKKSGWEYPPFTIENEKDYNQFIYFYEYARDAIYNTDKNFKNNQTTYNFEYNICNGKYKIKIKNKENPYELNIESISLKIYETGVAILCFNMENKKYACKEDIKIINDFGRRIYPQFLPLEKVKESFLSEYIEITGDNLKSKNLKEDFKSYENINFDISKNQSPVKLPEFIKKLFGENFSTQKEKNKVFVNPIIDDRMFTICWYGNNRLSHRLTQFENKHNQYTYAQDPFWHEFVFIDGKDATCKSKTMLPELLKKHTYNRWADYGTIYGITRYSFMLLTTEGKFSEDVLLKHLKTMYHQIAVLTLAQRASILNFSKRITDILNGNYNMPDMSDEISTLHKDYIGFINKMYFNEITAQEQGIEIYDIMLNHMRIKENIKNLNTQIRELHDFVELETKKISNKKLTFLSILGAVLLLPTFITGFLGMNVFYLDNKKGENFSSVQQIVMFIKEHEGMTALVLGFIIICMFLYLDFLGSCTKIKRCCKYVRSKTKDICKSLCKKIS
ncbi:MAG: hypothetical protein B6I26_06325 [Desulfobacteraceae bacterium 4572_130]|nr:MAG: hypothetical protein B6I26_06325 [Desulfobacteraceae bacterium 4572_130]